MSKFEVAYWGSHPDEGNDDCFSGQDFDTIEDAKAFFKQDPSDTSVAYIELNEYVGVLDNGIRQIDTLEIRKNPRFQRVTDDDWRREQAMEAGMLHGVDAYNEIMGWEVE